jgi:HD-GYP domain-containing protein (c-di-GMP phosphodiesterase class II)
MTMETALQMGMPSEKLADVRRGALLHDIGKLGIPDSILLKPGVLNEEERRVIEQHPIFAYNLLSTIEYLNKAIDIPYCHHEKWDGTGYPRNLKGEEIPIQARIFAVVDVYDALTSDRPYRKAWTREKALAYIVEQSGKHFDPAVVDVFLRIIKQEDKITEE